MRIRDSKPRSGTSGTKSDETIAIVLRSASLTLRPSRTASLDAQLLLAHVLGHDRAWVLAHHEAPVSERDRGRYLELVRRRAHGEPVAYLRGHVEWLDLDLEVNPAVLVPRPETELVFERACALGRHVGAKVIADIGTGSGALAIGLSRSLAEALVIAIDTSHEALQIARRNVERYGLSSRVLLVQGNLIEPLDRRPDLVVANLPYLSDAMMDEVSLDVRHEPRSALHAGETGLELYMELARLLLDRGWRVPVVAEIDPRQARELPRIFAEWHVEIEDDYAGRARIAIALPEAGR